MVAFLEQPWVPEMLAAGALFLRLLAELLHQRRVRCIRELAFGPGRASSALGRVRPLLQVLATGAVVWGLATLIVLPPAKHSADGDAVLREGDLRHVVLVLDVSPSMRLVDAGPDKVQSRIQRARDVLDSFFKRVPLHLYRMSVIATYNGAKPVVVDTRDIEVVRNILGDLPMHYAFPAGKTKLFDGLKEAATLAKHWNPGSTTLILVSDGDTVPAKGMPKMPASVANVVVVGVGDPISGKFIDGRQSRQDVPTLRQIAARLGGTFHNGNTSHLSTSLISSLTEAGEGDPLERLTRREYALLATLIGAAILALMAPLLHYFGTSWRPGVRALSDFSTPKAKNKLSRAS